MEHTLQYLDYLKRPKIYLLAQEQLQYWRNEQPKKSPSAVICGGGQCQTNTKSLEELVQYQGESKRFQNEVNNYLSNEGQHLMGYLNKTGHKVNQIRGVGSMELPDSAVAALVTYKGNGDEFSYLVSNGSGRGFKARTKQFAHNYALDEKSARDYIMTHEYMHAAGYDTEASCESAVAKYFASRAKLHTGQEASRYQRLAETAALRAREQSGAVYRAPGSKAYH